MTPFEFDKEVDKTVESLPQEFREAASGVVIRTPDFADDEVLDALGIDDPYHLLGLYHGINLAQKSVHDLPMQPDMVFIYRLPILAYSEATGEPLDALIRHVVIHELGHHFGLSDEDMEVI